jgi:hypothetical protein
LFRTVSFDKTEHGELRIDRYDQPFGLALPALANFSARVARASLVLDLDQ